MATENSTMYRQWISAISPSTNTNSRFSTRAKQSDFRSQIHLYTNVISGHMLHQNIAQFIPLFLSMCVLNIYKSDMDPVQCRWQSDYATEWAIQGSNPSSDNRYSSSPQRPYRFWVPEPFNEGWAWRYHLHLANRLRNSGATPPPLYTFMARAGISFHS
jgi:hypothetical protein